MGILDPISEKVRMRLISANESSQPESGQEWQTRGTESVPIFNNMKGKAYGRKLKEHPGFEIPAP